MAPLESLVKIANLKQPLKLTHISQAEFEKFGEMISASISQGTRKKFPKKKPAAAASEAEKKEENGQDKEGEGAANDDKKEDAAAVVTDDEGEKKEAADGEFFSSDLNIHYY